MRMYSTKNLTDGNIYAFHSITWLSIVADISATEAEVPGNQCTPSNLHNIYVNQLSEFNKKIEDLKKEGASSEAINSLRRVLEIRAAMPEEDIDRVLSHVGAYKKSVKNSNQPIGLVIPKRIDKRYLKKISEKISTNKALSRGQKMDMIKKEISSPGNALGPNKNFLPGIIGFVQAFINGFSQKQVQDIKSILSSSKSGEVTVPHIKNLVEPITPEQQKREEGISTLLSQGKIEQVFPKPADLPAEYNSEYTSWVEKIKAIFLSPKIKDVDVLNMISKAKPTQDQLDKILETFAVKSAAQGPQLDKINDRLQISNPIGDALWGNYIPALSREILVYTEHFSEAPKSRLINIESIEDLPGGITLADIIRKGETLPPGRNTAMEDILTLRLERLANFYGLDLENPNDIIRFNAFMDQFDVSPGERTLDFTTDSPPPEHTYDELPIIKLPSGEKMEDNLGF